MKKILHTIYFSKKVFLFTFLIFSALFFSVKGFGQNLSTQNKKSENQQPKSSTTKVDSSEQKFIQKVSIQGDTTFNIKVEENIFKKIDVNSKQDIKAIDIEKENLIQNNEE